LRAGEISVASLRVANLDADAELDGRDLVLRHAQGDFYGGRLAGNFEAVLTAAPAYTFTAEINRVNLGALAAATPLLAERLMGIASGDLTLTARGLEKHDLLASLAGEGALRARDAMVRGINFPSDNRSAGAAEAESRFNEVTAKFHLASGKIHIDESLFSGREGVIQATGDLDFARGLNLRAESAGGRAESADDKSLDAARDSWTIVGTLDAPQVARQTHVARERIASPGPRR
jgi:hypothetical protein